MSNTSICALVVGLGFSLVLIRLILACDWSQLWAQRCTDWHHNDALIPRLGGAVLVGCLAPLVLWICACHPSWLLGLSAPGAIILGSLSMFALGFWDDLRRLSPGKKLVVQLAISAAFCSTGSGLEVIKTPFTAAAVPLGALGIVLALAWLVAIPNLLNLVDGYDGLAGGIGLCSMILLALMAQAQPALQLLAFGMVGALVGFLRYNFPPAKIYLGDGGAYFLGFFVAASSLVIAKKGMAFEAMPATLLPLSLPLADAALTILRRGTRGLPLFRPDRKHLHHRLLLAGRARQEVLLCVYGLNSMLVVAGFRIFRSPDERWPWIFGGAFCGSVIFIGCCAASSPRFEIWTKLRTCWRMRPQVQYARSLVSWLELEAQRGRSPEELWPDLVFTANRLGLVALILKQKGAQHSWRKSRTAPGPVKTYPLGNGRWGSLRFEAAACVRGKSAPGEDCHSGHCRFGARACLLEPRLFDTITELLAEFWNRTMLQTAYASSRPTRTSVAESRRSQKLYSKATALLLAGCLLPAFALGSPLVDTNYLTRVLSTVPRPEVPAMAGSLVRKARPQLRPSVAVEVVRICGRLYPMMLANTVCEVARAEPGSVEALATAATRDHPELAVDVARAASVATPHKAAIIMRAVGQCAPRNVREVAVAITDITPNSAREVLLAAAAQSGQLKPYLETEITRCGSHPPSVERCFDRADTAWLRNRETPAGQHTRPAGASGSKPPPGQGRLLGGRNYARP